MGLGSPRIYGLDSSVAELTRVPGYDGEPARGRRRREESIWYMVVEWLAAPKLVLHDLCQRRLKIQPKGGAKDCHLGWWSDLGVRLGVGDAVRGFFGGSGQRSHAELKRSAPAGRPQGGMVYRVGVGLATRASGARCRPGPGDGVPQLSYRHCFCGRGFG